ncbi:MAG: hypothetical protein HQK52_14975 [Oligoflexia bacterium]|nr:hypothetical protein [Oligoflexia bacterium]
MGTRFFTAWTVIFALLMFELSPYSVYAMSGAVAAEGVVLSTPVPKATQHEQGEGNVPSIPFELQGYEQARAAGGDLALMVLNPLLMLMVGMYATFSMAMALTSCKMSMVAKASLVVFWIGMIGYIISEVIFMVKYKNVTAETIKGLKTGKAINDQIVYVHTMAKNVKEYRDALSLKMKGTIVVGGVFVVSAVLAYVESFLGHAKASNPLTGPGVIAEEAAEQPSEECVDSSVSLKERMTSKAIIAKYAAFSGIALVAPVGLAGLALLTPGKAAGAQGDRATSVNNPGIAGSPGPSSSSISGQNSDDPQIKKLAEQANKGSARLKNPDEIVEILSLTVAPVVGVAIGLLIYYFAGKPPKKCVAATDNHPLDALPEWFCVQAMRGIFLSVIAGITFSLGAILVKKLEEVERRLGYLNGVIEGLKATKQLGQDPLKLTADGLKDATINEENISLYENINENMADVCVNATTGAAKLDLRCGCANKPGGCMPEPLTIPSVYQNFPLPGGFASAGNQFLGYANALNSNRSALGQVSAGQVLQGAAKLRRLEDDVKKQINEQLKKSGRPAIDFQKEELKMYKGLVNGAKAALNQGGFSDNQIMGMGGQLGVGDREAMDNLAKELAKKEGVSSGGAASAAGAGDGKKGEGEDEFTLVDELPPPVAAVGDADNALIDANDKEHSLEEFEESYQDIHNNPKESIFVLVSTRYKRTAYPRFLELKP